MSVTEALFAIHRPPRQTSELAPLARARVRELDGLRGLAIILVVVWHYVVGQVQVPPGSIGAYGIRQLVAGLVHHYLMGQAPRFASPLDFVATSTAFAVTIALA